MTDNRLSLSPVAEKFFALLRYAIGQQTAVPDVQPDDWETLNVMASEQALLGVVYQGLTRMAGQLHIPEETVLLWYVQSEQIAEQDRRLNVAAVRVQRRFEKLGYGACVLKGQGNALMYPQPLSRMPGDIDVWLRGSVSDIVRLARSVVPGTKAVYHHVEFADIDGIPVEAHYRPSFMNNLVHNRRLQRWFQQQADEQFAHRAELPGGVGSIAVPTDAFNRIYQMAHIAHHVVHAGIGLRQILDYYYLLQRGFTPAERQRDEQLLRRFGLYDVASAVMYVLQQVFGLDADHLLVQPDARRGRFLLDEILLSGNFGQYDKRLQNSHGQLSHNWQRLKRDVRFVSYFTSECLWEPVFRWFHFFWRLSLNIRMSRTRS